MCECMCASMCLLISSVLFSLFDIIVDFALICLHFHLCCSFFSPLVSLWIVWLVLESACQEPITADEYEWLTDSEGKTYSQHIERHASCSVLHLLYFSFLILFRYVGSESKDIGQNNNNNSIHTHMADGSIVFIVRVSSIFFFAKAFP